jgi:hypothetical protein
MIRNKPNHPVTRTGILKEVEDVKTTPMADHGSF